MLGEVDVHAVIAVRDLDKAQDFYVDILGLDVLRKDMESILLKSGNTKLLLYISDNAGTNKATSASWDVGDVEGAVAELRDAGVKFEQYDEIAGVTRVDDVYTIGITKTAWFQDPDGNVLCVSSGI
jgi:catechol 2,3-dioxygenase-like lactoylglutathione lyase family enzyme